LLLINSNGKTTIYASIILRRSGPLLLRRAVRPGFSGASMSRTGSHPRRHNSLKLVEPPSQALKNATSSAFFTHAISAPLAPLMRARGKPKKPYSRRGDAQAPLPGIVSVSAMPSRGCRNRSWSGSGNFSAVAVTGTKVPLVNFQGFSPAVRRDAKAAGQ